MICTADVRRRRFWSPPRAAFALPALASVLLRYFLSRRLADWQAVSRHSEGDTSASASCGHLGDANACRNSRPLYACCRARVPRVSAWEKRCNDSGIWRTRL